MLWKPRKNADQEALYALKEFVHAIGLPRQEELNKFLPQHQNEIENLPQILKVRMKALKEVNPEKFSNSPELVLSTLAAADLIKQFPNGADKLERDVVDMVHKKYHLEQNSDVYSSLVPAIFHSYFRDVKNGNITQDGQIKNVEKSAVMRVVHNFEDYGVPIDAKKTVAEVKESTKNADQEALYALKEFVHAIGLSRQEELNKFLPQHQNEIENLPQILKVRMKALKEVNPEKFSNSPELVLSTLAAADLIKQFPNGADKLERDVVDMVHKKYHLEQNSDVYSSLVPAIFHSYFRDVKNGNITQDGQIKNVEKSAVMRVVHNFKGDGVPIDAKKTVAEVKESTKSSNGCSEIMKKVRHSLGLLRERKLNATCSPDPNKPVARIEKSANVFDILNMKREIEK